MELEEIIEMLLKVKSFEKSFKGNVGGIVSTLNVNAYRVDDYYRVDVRLEK